jgi:hypothetical protein
VTPAPEDCPSTDVGLLADLGDLSVGVVASGLRAGVAGVGAGLAASLRVAVRGAGAAAAGDGGIPAGAVG